MNKSRPSYLRPSIIATAFLFLVLMISIVQDYRLYFTSIDSAVLADDIVWGINVNGNDTSLFQVSVDTGLGSFLNVPMYEDKRIITISDPFFSDGMIYYRKTLCTMDGTFTEKLVCWDVKKNKLVECQDKELIQKWENGQIGPEAVRADSFEPDNTVTEIDPPEGSRLQKNGNVQLGIRRNGDLKVLDYVRTKARATHIKVIVAVIVSVLLFAALMIIGNLASYYRVYPGMTIRLGILSLIALAILVPLIEDRLDWDMYVYAGQNMLEYCADSAYIRGTAIDLELLEKFIDGEEEFSAERMQDLWKYNLKDGSSDEGLSNSTFSGAFSSYEKDRKERKAWSLYDNYVITEDTCIVYRKNADIRFLYNDEAQDVPWIKSHSLVQQKYINRAFSTNQIQAFITTVGNHRYAVAYAPVKTDSGDLVLVGTRISLGNIIILFFHVRERVLRVITLLAVAFLILALAVVVMALWPIGNLKEAINKITAGDFTARTRCWGFNEFHYLARLFNAMANRLEEQSAGTDSYRMFYDRFLPASLLRKMSGRSVVGALNPSAVYQANACCSIINVQGTSEERRNSLYETAIEIAERYGGYPAEFDSKQLRLIYMESTEKAIRAVTEFQQSLVADQMPFANVGMASSRVQICVIGNDGQKNVTVQDSAEAEILSVIAANLNIPVILTEDLYLNVMRNTAKLHFRCLGRVGLDDYVPDASLYELLDANDASVRAVREFGRTAFEKGAKAYAAGDYFTARNEMIKALDLDPGDLIARCYVLNCDRKEPPTVCQVMIQEN